MKTLHLFIGKKLHYPGFTLIEELIALSLSSIVIYMSILLLSSAVKSYNTYKAMCRLKEDGSYAMEQISREVSSMHLGPDSIGGPDHGILNLKDPSDPERTICIKCGMIDGRNVLERVVYYKNSSINTRKIIDNAKNIVFDYDCYDNLLSVSITTKDPKGSACFTICSNLYFRIGG